MKTAHSIDQIIDLEYFLHEDATQSPSDLHLRDREIGLELERHTREKLSTSERISGWVLARRSDVFAQKHLDSPGTIFSKSRSLASTLTVIKGLLTGIFTGLAFFAYAGNTPINVLEFLIFFVFSQISIVVLLLIGLLLKKISPTLTVPSSSFYILHTIGKKVFSFIHKSWFSDFPKEKHDSIRHAYGIVQRNHQLYGPLFYWAFFSLAQLFGIAFNAGLLTSSLLKIITSDLAFGWQSTLQLSSRAIEQMVQLLATPWSWLLPQGVGSPTLLQIEGSHIILKDGIFHLTTTDLVAWWPFLILCLLVYGLFVRVLFYLSAHFLENQALNKVQFRSPECHALLRRMNTPVVTTQATPETETLASPQVADIVSEKETNTGSTYPQILLIPEEIRDSIPTSELNAMMAGKGFTTSEQYLFMAGYDEDQELLEQLAKRQWTSDEGIFIIMESWMVPLVSFIVFVQELRKVARPETTIEIGLTGKGTDHTFAVVRAADMEIWRKKIISMGDAYIQVLPITGISQ